MGITQQPFELQRAVKAQTGSLTTLLNMTYLTWVRYVPYGLGRNHVAQQKMAVLKIHIDEIF